jgi:hypothetical protein
VACSRASRAALGQCSYAVTVSWPTARWGIQCARHGSRDSSRIPAPQCHAARLRDASYESVNEGPRSTTRREREQCRGADRGHRLPVSSYLLQTSQERIVEADAKLLERLFKTVEPFLTHQPSRCPSRAGTLDWTTGRAHRARICNVRRSMFLCCAQPQLRQRPC